MSGRLSLATATLGILALTSAGAFASVVSFQSGATLSTSPVVIQPGGALSSYSFTAATTGNGPGAAVQSTGNSLVTSFFGSLTDFEAGSSIDRNGELYDFSAFSPAALIPNSPADDFIGLSFTLADGVHYGYAEVAGASLVSYGYDTTPGASILTGAVPEPASLALLLVGGLGVLATRMRRRS